VKNTVREERLEADLTQAALADACGVSRQTIIAIESGKYIPSTALALKLGKALGKSVEELFRLEKGD